MNNFGLICIDSVQSLGLKTSHFFLNITLKRFTLHSAVAQSVSGYGLLNYLLSVSRTRTSTFVDGYVFTPKFYIFITWLVQFLKCSVCNRWFELQCSVIFKWCVLCNKADMNVPDAWGPGGVYKPGPVSTAAPGAKTPLSEPGEVIIGILGCSSCTIGLLLLCLDPPAIRTTRKHTNNVFNRTRNRLRGWLQC